MQCGFDKYIETRLGCICPSRPDPFGGRVIVTSRGCETESRYACAGEIADTRHCSNRARLLLAVVFVAAEPDTGLTHREAMRSPTFSLLGQGR